MLPGVTRSPQGAAPLLWFPWGGRGSRFRSGQCEEFPGALEFRAVPGFLVTWPWVIPVGMSWPRV